MHENNNTKTGSPGEKSALSHSPGRVPTIARPDTPGMTGKMSMPMPEKHTVATKVVTVKGGATCDGEVKSGDPHKYLGHFRSAAVVKKGHNVGAPVGFNPNPISDPTGAGAVPTGAVPTGAVPTGSVPTGRVPTGSAGIPTSNPTVPKTSAPAAPRPSGGAVSQPKMTTEAGGFRTPAPTSTFKPVTPNPVKQRLQKAVGAVRSGRQKLRQSMRGKNALQRSTPRASSMTRGGGY